jgi:pimeloyl-ACP methyl ester carboxylesterase
MSVPYIPLTPGEPKFTEQMRAIAGDGHFYQLYFQEPGRVEQELEENIPVSVRRLLISAGGEALEGKGFPFIFDRSKRFVDALPPPAESNPPWLSDADLEFFTREFERTGFRGGLNWYRNMDRSQELLAALQNAKIRQPSLFIAGEKDVVITMYRPFFDALEQTMPGLTGKHLLAGVGHWVQQEAAEEVNRLLLAFLGTARSAAAV